MGKFPAWLLTAGFLSIIILLTQWGGLLKSEPSRDSSPKTPDAVEETVSSSPLPSSSIREARLIAVGDIMMHNTQTEAGYDARTDRYNFDSFFTEISPLLKKGDWVIGNLETPLAGKDLKYTGYPLFNAPPELASALKKAGFTILTTANNHALDRGEIGVIRTREAIQAEGMETTGTAGSEEEGRSLLLLSENGITLAFLAYTYGTNGIPFPEGKEYLVSQINLEKMKEDIRRAKEEGAEGVVLSIHFGQEYQRFPDEEQKKMAETLIRNGADLILGSHPHVVQPVQEMEVPDGKGGKRKGVVIYSLGNFIAAQKGKYTNLGVVFSATFQKTFPSGELKITRVETVPTWIQQYRKGGKRAYRVLPLPVSEEKAKEDPDLSMERLHVLEADYREMMGHLSSLPALQWNPSSTLMEETTPGESEGKGKGKR
ncbi:CapA family protein [Thermicanus aegyptius]|uniref:CapA family protein n=1 Tax=Thermicanus aegyptius TaxID=94009 RepID=UPI0004154544|nr:CapA family protein [Thermicanus aegyptius]